MSSRDDILGAAQRLLNAEPSASMADLAAAAGVGRATVHRYFSTREALLHELGVRSLDRWETSLGQAGVESAIAAGDPAGLDACIRDLLRRYLADCDEFGFTLVDPYVTSAPDLVERSTGLEAREAGLFVAAQAAGVLRPGISSRWISHAVYGLLIAARSAITAGAVARRDLDDYFISTFLDGMRAS